jgi:hypothetical protein
MKRVVTTINLAARCWLDDAAPAKSKLKTLRKEALVRLATAAGPPPAFRCKRDKILLLRNWVFYRSRKRGTFGIFNAEKMQFLVLPLLFPTYEESEQCVAIAPS